MDWLTALIILLNLKLVVLNEEFKIEAEPDVSCRDRTRLIGTDRNDLYELVTAALNDTVQLQCHFCHEIDDQYPKIWYYQDQITSNSSREVDIDMETNPLLSKYFVTTSHTLIIRNVTTADGGFYYCHGRMGQEMQYKYNYLIDVMYNSNITSYIGNLTSWSLYQKEVLAPMNSRFKSSIEPDLFLLRENFGIVLEVITEWGSWGKCQACGHPAGQAEKTRTGFCRIRRKMHISERVENGSTVAFTGQDNAKEHFIVNAFKLSCRSVFFNKIFPEIGNFTTNIPQYVQIDACVGTCISESSQKGWQSKKSSFKYKKSYVISESAHLTLVCPESTMESEVVWKRDNKELEKGSAHNLGNKEKEPHIAVDTFSTLYILDATVNEGGNYTCSVDDFKMQEVTVIVVSKSVLLTKAFLRHMAYLAFVLSLTLTCYCAGLFIMCKRRKNFKDYEELERQIETAESEESSNSENDGPGAPSSLVNLADLLKPLTETATEKQSGRKSKRTLKKEEKLKTRRKFHTASYEASYSYLDELETTPNIQSADETQTEYSDASFYSSPRDNINLHRKSARSEMTAKAMLHDDHEDKTYILDTTTNTTASTPSQNISPIQTEDEHEIIRESRIEQNTTKISDSEITQHSASKQSSESESIYKTPSEITDDTALVPYIRDSSERKENISEDKSSVEPKSLSSSEKSVLYSNEPEYAMRILLYQYNNKNKIDDEGPCRRQAFDSSLKKPLYKNIVLSKKETTALESSSSVLQQIHNYDKDDDHFLTEFSKIDRLHASNEQEKNLYTKTCNDSACSQRDVYSGNKNSPERLDVPDASLENLSKDVSDEKQAYDPSATLENLCSSISTQTLTRSSIVNSEKKLINVVDSKKINKKSRFGLMYNSLKKYFSKEEKIDHKAVFNAETSLLLNSESDEEILYEYKYDNYINGKE